MGAHLERARLLLGQSRHELAEQELRLELAEDPQNAEAHALLALCLSEQKKYAPATEEAKQAIALAPDEAFGHYALAHVMFDRRRFDEALVAAREAVGLEPADADYHALVAQVLHSERRWDEALETAETGLQLDPEHVACNNLRAMSLVKLGRRQEAGQTLEAALARDPEDAVSHANRGWTLLEGGDPNKAMEHFREALRLQPQMEWARLGIVEALKAKNPVYRILLKYFFWMSRMSSRAQWGVILGAYFGYRILRNVAQSNPHLAPYINPVCWAYTTFALITWLARPLFDLVLRLNRFGRLALPPDRVTASNCLGLCLLAALASAGIAIASDSEMAVLAAGFFGILSIPVAGAFMTPEGWPRKVMGGYVAGLFAVGLLFFVLPFLSSAAWEKASMPLLWIYLVGAVLSQWVVNGLAGVRVRR